MLRVPDWAKPSALAGNTVHNALGTALYTLVAAVIPASLLSWLVQPPWDSHWLVLYALGIALVLSAIWALVENARRARSSETTLVALENSRAPAPFEGFNRDWPDAIRCKANMPGSSHEDDADEIIFYFSKIMKGRSVIGSPVAVYFVAGGFNDNERTLRSDKSWNWARPRNGHRVGYAPHELWFRTSHPRSLVRPGQLSEGRMDGQDEVYCMQFADIGHIDFGGETMDEIIAKGRGYIFARRMTKNETKA